MIESKEFVLADKTKVIIRFSFLDSRNNIDWRISDIKYKKPRQRKWSSFEDSFIDRYGYRRLTMNEREIYRYRQFIDFCGEEILKAAYQDVYDRIKPGILRQEEIT